MTQRENFENPNHHERRTKLIKRASTGVAAVALAASGSLMARSFSETPAPSEIQYTVQTDDTLSEIALNACIDKPVQYPVIEERIVDLQTANNLSSNQVHEGQVLIVPRDICE